VLLRVRTVTSFVVDDQLANVERAAQGSRLGPKARAELRLGPSWTTFAGYGNGFRSPQASSLGDGEQTTFTQVHSFELGARCAHSRRFAASVAAFQSMLDNGLVSNETTSRNSEFVYASAFPDMPQSASDGQPLRLQLVRSEGASGGP
jgi:outer membrane receptor for Fe3+-dicitrate